MKQLRAELLRPQLAISAEGIGYPGDTLDLRVRYRTMDAPVTLNIYVTNLSGYSTRYDCNNNKTFRSLSPRRVYSRQLTLNPLPAEHKSEADLPYLESLISLIWRASQTCPCLYLRRRVSMLWKSFLKPRMAARAVASCL